MTPMTLVLAGFPELAGALRNTSRFERILSPESTGQLRDQLGEISSIPKEQLLFLFAANLPVDTPQTLEFLVQRLVSMGYRVALLELGPLARDIASSSGGTVGLVPGPYHVNAILGALSNMAGMMPIEPVQDHWAFEEIVPGSGNVPSSAAPAWDAPAVQASAPAWDAPAAPVAPVAPAPQPEAPAWGAPSTPAPSPAWDTPTPAPTWDAPVAPQPEAPSWDAPAPAPAWDAPAPAPAPAWDAPLAPQPEAPAWGAPSVPSWDAPAPDPTPAPAWDAPAAPSWGAPATPVAPVAPQPEAPAWGAPTAPAWDAPVQQPGDAWAAPAAPAWDAPAPVVNDPNPAGGWPQPGPAWGGTPAQGAWDAPVPTGNWDPSGMASSYGHNHQKGFVLVIAAPKGGVGKSTLSTNLAAYMGLKLQQLGKSVCLVDTNVQNSDVGKILGAYRPTIVDVARYANQLNLQVIQQNMLHRKDLNLSALLGPDSPEKASPAYINGRLYRDVVQELKKTYDYIIVDTSVADMYHNVMADFVIPEMDYMAVITIPNYQTIHNVDQFLRALCADKHAGGFAVDSQRVGIVLNQEQEGVGADERDIREELAAWRYLGAIPYSKEWIRAANNYELVATRNYPDLHHAFDTVLYQITNEQVFVPIEPAGDKKKGLLSGLLGRKGKK